MLSPDDITEYIYERLPIGDTQNPKVKKYTFNVHMTGYVITSTVDVFVNRIRNQMLVSGGSNVDIVGPIYTDETCFINKSMHTHARWTITTS